MKYTFTNDVRPFDFWIISMSGIYRSLAGVCNIVFTIAMMLLCYRFWNSVGDILQLALIMGCCMFIVIQPLFVYMRAKAQAAMVPKGMKLCFDDYGLHVQVGEECQDIKWKNLRLSQQKRVTFIRSDEKHGYMLTNRMLGNEKEAFIEYASSQIEKYR